MTPIIYDGLDLLVRNIFIIDGLFRVEFVFAFRNFFIISTPSVAGWVDFFIIYTFRRSVFLLNTLGKM